MNYRNRNRHVYCVYFIALSFILIGFAQCNRRSEYIVRPAWMFEGWACEPQLNRLHESVEDYCASESKREWVFLKFTARASERAVASENNAHMEGSCRAMANDFIRQPDALQRMVYDMQGCCSATDCGLRTEAYDTIQQLTANSQRMVYNCCPLDIETGHCSADNEWRECRCLGVVHVPGGQDALQAALSEE